MDYEKLKEVIAKQIKENGQREITGPVLQAVLMAMVDSLGEVYPHTYTDEEKAQARANIDALSNHNGEITKEKLSLEVQAILNDVANKQNISDATLATIAKTIVGAINEVYKGGLEDASIATSKIKDGAVTDAKIANGAVTTPKIANDAVTTEKVYDGAITEPKLDTDLVNIITSAVQPAELASAIATALASYVAKADIVDTTGSATDKVMSQHGVTEAIDGVTNKVTELGDIINGNKINVPDILDGRYLTNEGSYGNWSSGGYSIIVDISSFIGEHITTKIDYSVPHPEDSIVRQYAFLSSYDSEKGYFAEGCTRVSGKPDNTLIPEGAKYIYLYLGSSDVQRYLPIVNVTGETDGLSYEIESIKTDKASKKELEDAIQIINDKIYNIEDVSKITEKEEVRKEEILTKDSSDFAVRDGYITEGGDWSTSYTTQKSWVLTVHDNISVYVKSFTGQDGSGYCDLSIFNGDVNVSNFLERLRNTENNLPTEQEPLQLTSGMTIVISTMERSLFELSVVSNSTVYVLKPNVVFDKGEKQIAIQYINGSGVDSSTERFLVYVPSHTGYIRYDFVHSVSSDRNTDVWRIAYAYACDDNMNEKFVITAQGEWEIAVKLNDRPDFSGGFIHGDMKVKNIVFFANGVKITPSDCTTLTKVNDFSIVEYSELYDPNDSTTIIAEHGSEHLWSNGELIVRQSLKWIVSEQLSNCYMAMHLPLKSLTDTFYTDVDYNARLIGTPNYTIPNAKSVTLYGNSVATFFSIEEYPQGKTGGNAFRMTDNGGEPYNKCYYYVSTGGSVSAGELWKSTTKYRFEFVG